MRSLIVNQPIANKSINNTGLNPAVIGAIVPDKNVVKPIALLVIADPNDNVAATIIILGQDTPLTIDSFKLISGFLFCLIIDKIIIPSSGGIAVPNLLIHVDKLPLIKLGNTHKAITNKKTTNVICSANVDLAVSFFILSNSFDFKFRPFVSGLIINLNTNIIAKKINIPVGTAYNIY